MQFFLIRNAHDVREQANKGVGDHAAGVLAVEGHAKRNCHAAFVHANPARFHPKRGTARVATFDVRLPVLRHDLNLTGSPSSESDLHVHVTSSTESMERKALTVVRRLEAIMVLVPGRSHLLRKGSLLHVIAHELQHYSEKTLEIRSSHEALRLVYIFLVYTIFMTQESF